MIPTLPSLSIVLATKHVYYPPLVAQAADSLSPSEGGLHSDLLLVLRHPFLCCHHYDHQSIFGIPLHKKMQKTCRFVRSCHFLHSLVGEAVVHQNHAKKMVRALCASKISLW